MVESRQPSAAVTLREMAAAYRTSQLLFLAVRLGLPDLLSDGPRTPDHLAQATGTHPGPLRRVLRGMACIGLVEEMPDGRFGSTELADHLRTDHPSAVRDNVSFTASEENTLAWAALERTLRTGVAGFEHAFGMPRFRYLQLHPEWATVFQKQMSLQVAQVARAVVAAYDFSGVSSVADIGGGRGTLLAAILASQPHVRGTLFDLPEVVADAELTLRQAGVRDRCSVVGGDFFEAIPQGADLYLLSWILHDWPDEDAARILARCARHLHPGTRLLVIERLLPAHADRSAATREALLGDVHMLAVLTGRERTQAEFAALLASAGFRLERVIPTSSPRAILEAVRLQ